MNWTIIEDEEDGSMQVAKRVAKKEWAKIKEIPKYEHN